MPDNRLFRCRQIGQYKPDDRDPARYPAEPRRAFTEYCGLVTHSGCADGSYGTVVGGDEAARATDRDSCAGTAG